MREKKTEKGKRKTQDREENRAFFLRKFELMVQLAYLKCAQKEILKSFASLG